jgi:hypothetical protein
MLALRSVAMRIPTQCWACLHDELRAEEDERLRAEAAGETPPERPYRIARREDWYRLELAEDNAYVGKCRKDHTITLSLHNIRYELLFEAGIVAMFMGFNREAVSSIAVAMERFFEFAIEIFVHNSKVERALYDETWKLLKNNSERQLGAFLFLYLTNMNKPFLEGKARHEFDNDRKNFRNRIVHQGQFPTRAEVEDYARYVFDLIFRTIRELEDRYPDAILHTRLRQSQRGRDVIEKKVGPPQPDQDGRYWSVSGSELITMLSTFVKGRPDDFDSRLADAKDRLWLWGLQPVT